MKVLKFGGTSVGSAGKMKKIVPLIQREAPVFVVLSAMGGTTDRLTGMIAAAKNGNMEAVGQEVKSLKDFYFATAREISDDAGKETFFYIETVFNGISDRLKNLTKAAEKDVLAAGEKLSTFLFHRLLLQNGIEAVWLDATQLMWLDEQGEPRQDELEKRLWITFQKHRNTQVFVTQGFICRNHRGETDNLGRGGSDYSASLFGAAAGAEEIQIWTDIDGVQNNDPRVVENTRPVRHLRFDEAAELAYFGAKILHPMTILPAQKADIPVLLKNTMHPEDPGTTITAQHDGKGFKAVAARDGITAIRIKSSRMLLAYGFMRKVFEVFETFETPIDMVTTSEVAVSITIDDDRRLPEIVEALKPYGRVDVEKNKTIVGVVGLIHAHEPGYANQLFAALNDIPIRMISYGASPYNFSLLVDTGDKEKTLQALNRRLFHNEQTEKINEIQKMG
ncbi:aspartate kinase [Candidatus Sulfidibacterium hydrothermale]|uniref:aspartate kinase n=1 Tax=Candidatus Sulfidibacterium hydrothermale TaxID=2875962 RepID=UPI001F0ADAF0|nr:aspartate kinase [Candidatus Sulfidibacterium hydrothermale]UBM63561.1 aspartate kinase [Candidatus Sulfidibacterium hydrothermale]